MRCGSNLSIHRCCWLFGSAQQANQVQRVCTSTIHAKPFDQIISLHLRSLFASHMQQHANAIQLQTQAAEYDECTCTQAIGCSLLAGEFYDPSALTLSGLHLCRPSLSRLLYAAMEADRESNWSLPLINVVLRQLRVCAYGADALLESSGEKPRHMIEVQDVLKRFLQKMVIDRAPLAQSKKQGCLFIIVHLFKLYFKLNNLKLCTFLIKMVSQLPPLKDFPKAQVKDEHGCVRRIGLTSLRLGNDSGVWLTILSSFFFSLSLSLSSGRCVSVLSWSSECVRGEVR